MGLPFKTSYIPKTYDDNYYYDFDSKLLTVPEISTENISITGNLKLGETILTSTAVELNLLDGVTASTSEINILDGVTSTAAEINILDGVTSTAAEINILDGVTSTAAEINILDGVTSTTDELNIMDGLLATTAELNKLNGVTTSTSELNILNGISCTTNQLNLLTGSSAGTVVNNKAVIYNSSGFIIQTKVPTAANHVANKSYVDSAITNNTNTNITLTQAIQSNITQLGVLTELQIDNIKLNGNTLSSTAGTDLLITPLAGQQIVLDGAINIDAGVVTGATSISSTVFVGNLTGNASGSAATVTGATQTAITQVGILTGLAIGGDIDCTGSVTGVITTAAQQYITRIGSLSQSYFKCVNNEAEVYNGTRFNILTPITVFNNRLVLTSNADGAGMSAINASNTGYGDVYIGTGRVKLGWKNASHVYTSAIDCTNNNIDVTGNIIAQGNITASANNSILSVSANNDTAHTLGNVKIGHVGHNNWAAFSHMDCANQTDYALLQSSDGITNVNAKTEKHIALCINNAPRLRVFTDQTRLDDCELRIVNTGGSMTHFNLPNNTFTNYIRGTTEFNYGVWFTSSITGAGANSILSVAANTDTSHTLGNAKIGHVGQSNWAAFSHMDCATTSKYALIQSSTGVTLLNSAAGEEIYFQEDNVYWMHGNSAGVTITPPLSVAANTDSTHTLGRAKIGHIGDIDWAAFSHMDCANQTDYALLQGYNGVTNLNAKVGTVIQLCINNVAKLRVLANGNISIGATSTYFYPVGSTELRTHVNGILIHRLNGHPNGSFSQNMTYATQNLYTGGAWTSFSDDRLKHNEYDIINGLDIIRLLTPQRYQRTKELYDADYNGDLSGYFLEEAGFIAQDVMKIPDLSFAVGGGDYTDESGNIIPTPYNLRYHELFVFNMAATKELDSIVTTQAATITTLEAKLAAQEARIAHIESRLG